MSKCNTCTEAKSKCKFPRYKANQKLIVEYCPDYVKVPKKK